MKPIFVCLSLVLFLAGCGKSEDESSTSDSPDSGGTSASGNASTGDKPWEDPAKPYLDDKKMDNFVASLKDPKGPFDAVAGGKVTAFNAGARMDEFDAAAKKHGFSSGEEYLGTWLRIGGAMTQVAVDDSNESMIKMHEQTIQQHEANLKKPEVTAEMKTMLEDQIKQSKATIVELKKQRAEGINAQDIATYKKHRAEFDAAMKEFSDKK